MRERTRCAGYKGSQAACSRARLALAVRTVLSKRSIDDTIVFHPAITFVIGEYGTGKSTVLEAIAVGWGRNPSGMKRGNKHGQQTQMPSVDVQWSTDTSTPIFANFFDHRRAVTVVNFQDCEFGQFGLLRATTGKRRVLAQDRRGGPKHKFCGRALAYLTSELQWYNLI